LEMKYGIAIAESCTGGLLAKRITDMPGSSRYFERGFVTYSNEAKCELLGVAAGTIKAHLARGRKAMADLLSDSAHGSVETHG